MDDHLGDESYERSDNETIIMAPRKKARGNYSEFELNVPQDRRSTFEP